MVTWTSLSVTSYLHCQSSSLCLLRGENFIPSVPVSALYQRRIIYGWTWNISGMIIERRNRIARRKTFPATLCTPQMPHEPLWNKSRFNWLIHVRSLTEGNWIHYSCRRFVFWFSTFNTVLTHTVRSKPPF